MTKYTIDSIGAIIQHMRDVGSYDDGVPYYMYGHRLEVSARLLEKDKDSVYKYQKYPLIVLNMPFPVTEGHWHEATINIAFMTSTDKKYNTEQRYTNVITPILEPMFEDFISKLQLLDYFVFESWDFTRIDRPFWGSDEGGKNIFNDPLDAIEIRNLTLKRKN